MHRYLATIRGGSGIERVEITFTADTQGSAEELAERMMSELTAFDKGIYLDAVEELA